MGTETTVPLRVVGPYPEDVPSGDCRLHPETMDRLGLEAGDIVEVVHDLGTVGSRVRPADDNWKPSLDVATSVIGIRLGSRLPGPSSDLSGERVSVRKANPPAAERVVYESLPSYVDPDAAAIVSRENLIGALASAGSRMPVYEKRGSSTHGHLLRVFVTEPDGVVLVTGETALEARSPDGRPPGDA